MAKKKCRRRDGKEKLWSKIERAGGRGWYDQQQQLKRKKIQQCLS